MLFFIFCEDHDNTAQLRREIRETHLAYIREFEDHILVGGPTLAPDAETMDGTFMIIDLPDRHAVDDFLAGDPYNRAGMFRKITVKPWRLVRLVAPSAE